MDLLNTTNNRCYSTLREFFVPHQRLLVLLRLDHDPSSIRSGWLGRPHLAAFFGASGGGYGVVWRRRSPPGISSQQDSDDDSVNNDEAGRDVAFYYKDDGSEVRGPYSRDTFSRWFHAGHFPRGTVLSLDDQFADIAGTAEELFPMCFPPPGSPPVDDDKKKRKKSNKKNCIYE